MIIQVLPLFPADQLLDGRNGNAISCAYFAQRWSIRLFPNKQYLARLSFGNFARFMIFSARAVVSAFGNAIEYVVSILSKPEMGWVAARRIVAPMENIYAVRDWAVAKSPSHTMGSSKLFAVPCESITGVISGPLPCPALIRAARFVHFGPKHVYSGWLCTGIAVMAKTSVMLVTQAERLVLPIASIDFANSHGDGFTSCDRRMQR